MDAPDIASDPETWLDHSIAQFNAHPVGAPMAKSLAFALLGRIDAHGRDRRTARLYPIDLLRAAFATADGHHSPR